MTKKVKLGRFQLNFSDRTSYTLIALVVIIFLGVGVYAIAPNPGHTTNQIDWSGLIPQIKTSNLCLGTDCRPSWPTNASETDPTVTASVKDGVSWSELSGIPAGFLDGVDDVGTGGTDNGPMKYFIDPKNNNGYPLYSSQLNGAPQYTIDAFCKEKGYVFGILPLTTCTNVNDLSCACGYKTQWTQQWLAGGINGWDSIMSNFYIKRVICYN